MRITVITPSFNQAAFIEQTIDSVLSQGYSNLQYIIIDGGSTDGSVEIIKKYEKHLSFWISEPDQGQSHAINKGLKLATGEIINWLNSDDYYEPNTLNIISPFFKDPQINVVCARSRKFGDGHEFFSNGTDVYFNSLAKTIGYARIDQPETFFRKSTWDQLGYLNESLHYLMDREFWIRYLLWFGLKGIQQVDCVTVNFRLHPSSKSVSQAADFQKEHDAIFYHFALMIERKDLAELIVRNFPIDLTCKFEFPKVQKELLQKSLEFYMLHRAHEFYYKGNHRLCREILKFTNLHFETPEEKALLKQLKFKSSAGLSPFVKLAQRWNHN
jgi:glycosyltransferase involved in cell wall biosynthesis